MKKKRISFYLPLIMSMVLLCYSCHDSDEENIFSQLKENGKINTFSLTLIVSDQLNDSSLSSIKNLCIFSGDNCKTLPDAGILRLGTNMYYPYNSISDLRIPESIANNEEAISKTVEEQVNVYFSTNKPKDYDSLLSPNRTDWNPKNLALSYINKIPVDSVLFFSDRPQASTIEVGKKSYDVYTSAADLRRKIDELICKGYGSVNVFFNPPASLSGPASAKAFPAKGIVVGDTCIGPSKFEKINDGYGSFMAGKLLVANSPDCGGGIPDKVTAEPTEKPIVPKETSVPKAKDENSDRRPAKEKAIVTEKPVIKENIPVERRPARSKINETETETDVINNNSGARGSNRCVRRSDPLCETDASGNYTGRRVQLCYNNKGIVVQTIVLAKCDSDCRCF